LQFDFCWFEVVLVHPADQHLNEALQPFLLIACDKSIFGGGQKHALFETLDKFISDLRDSGARLVSRDRMPGASLLLESAMKPLHTLVPKSDWKLRVHCKRLALSG